MVRGEGPLIFPERESKILDKMFIEGLNFCNDSQACSGARKGVKELVEGIKTGKIPAEINDLENPYPELVKKGFIALYLGHALLGIRGWELTAIPEGKSPALRD